MKKSFQLIFTILCLITVSTTYGQWTTSGTNVSLTPPTNNVVIGPTPTTSTQLYLNNTNVSTNSPTILTIDNNTSNPSGAPVRKSELDFNVAGTNFYKIYYSTFGYCGSGLFHIVPATPGPGIHMSSSQIAFTNSVFGGSCGANFGVGKYVFDGTIGSSAGINIGYDGQVLTPPSGYTLTNSGLSYFKDKVLIGTTSTAVPTTSYKLYVGGTAICEELIVKLQASWPDFVFAPTYKLMPLNEVKTYIAENSHLPNVPAACEIEEKGVATGEMLTIQMKKIEELTLYLIQMEERIKELEAQNKALQK